MIVTSIEWKGMTQAGEPAASSSLLEYLFYNAFCYKHRKKMNKLILLEIFRKMCFPCKSHLGREVLLIYIYTSNHESDHLNTSPK
jgi:hypothetical protein